MKIIIKIISFLTVYAIAGSVTAGLYRWVDTNGKVHYSDKVPQTIAQRGHEELNENGLLKKVVISANKRKEQKELAASLKIQQKEQAKLKKEQDLAEMRDIQMMNMFTTTDELITVYNSKFEMTDDSINLLKARHKSQSEKLEKLENRHERTKNPQSQEVLAKKIDDLLDNLKIYQQAITENYVEKEKLKIEFKTTLARFSELIARQKTSSK